MKTQLLLLGFLLSGIMGKAQITFSDITYPMPGNKPQCIAVKSNGYIFVGADSAKILRSTDGGLSFTKTYVMAGQGTSNKVYQICEMPSGTLLAYATMGRIFRSTDAGNNWSVINAGLSAYGPYYLAVNSNTVYAFEGSRVKKSTDDGLTWSYWGTQQGAYVAFDNNAKAYIAGESYNGLYTSTDGNNTATPVAATAFNMVNKVLVTPNQYVHLYIGTSDYRNSLNGSTFTSHYPTGLSTLSDMINYGNTIIISAAGASGPGIQYTTDNGATFLDLSSAMGTHPYITFYNFMAIDNNGILYVIAEDNSGNKKLMKTNSGIPATGIVNGMNELKESNRITVFPNPANQQISVLIPDQEEIKEIMITDLSGKICITGNQTSIDISALADGMYLVHVTTDQYRYNQKLVVAH